MTSLHATRALLVWLVVSGASCRQGRPTSPHQATPTPASLFDRLVQEVGARGPVAIVPSAEGIIAISLDGTRRQVLASRPVQWVFVDNRSRVLWFQQSSGGKSELSLLDLTQPNPSPEVVVTGLPQDELLAVGYASKPGEATDIVIPPLSAYDGSTHLLLHPTRPSMTFEDGQYDLIFKNEHEVEEKAVPEAKIVAAALPRLQELALRGPDRLLLLRASSPDKPVKVAAVSADRCEEPELCGTGEPIPGTPLLRVRVSHSCGDACHVSWQLYDPNTREFIDFNTRKRSPQPIDDGEGGGMSDAWISREGEGFIIGGVVYRIDGHRVFTGNGRAGGWLGDQWHVGL